MKAYALGLLNSVVSSYDQTKTTVAGRAFQKTIGAQSVLGPPLTEMLDFFTDTGFTTAGTLMHLTKNNRLFVLGVPVAGVYPVYLYNFDLATGAKTYVGKVAATLPSFTPVSHGFRVVDNGTTGWKIFIGVTQTTVITGGVHMVNKSALSHFTQVLSVTYTQAMANDVQGMYFLQDSANLGAAHLQTAAAALSLPTTVAGVWLHNGIAATHQFFVYDYTIAPTYTAAVAVTSISNATPAVVTLAGHGYVANDQVVFSTTGSLPTGLVVGTPYFVIATGLTSSAFGVSLTLGGAAINTSSAGIGTHSIGRAFGTTGSMLTLKTGNLPGLSGTMLTNNSENACTPGHTANSGFECAFIATTTSLYLGQYSDLITGGNGGTSWGSLIIANILGTGSDITAPTAVQAAYSSTADLAIYSTNVSLFVAKKFVNNQINLVFGGLSTAYLEGSTIAAPQLQLVTVATVDVSSGWLVVSGATIGQRVILAMDLRSDSSVDYSSVISPVFTAQTGTLNFLKFLQQLSSYTNTLLVQYRTSGFGAAAGGWTTVDYTQAQNIVIPSTGIQFKILFNIASYESNTPAQIAELTIGVTPLNETSDNWVGSNDNTTSLSPAKSAFRLVKTYAATVPKLYFRAYDDTGTLVTSANTTDNPTLFSYSTNNGTSWSPLGTIPNTALTTEVRYDWVAPPVSRVTVSLRES